MDFTHLLPIIGGREDGEDISSEADRIERRQREEQEQETLQLDIIYATVKKPILTSEKPFYFQELLYVFLSFLYFYVRIRTLWTQPSF